MELKSGEFGTAANQIEGGIRFLESIAKADDSIDLRLAVAAKKKGKATKLVQQTRFQFHARGYTIRLVDCGTPVANL
jgi:hypothetical protein